MVFTASSFKQVQQFDLNKINKLRVKQIGTLLKYAANSGSRAHHDKDPVAIAAPFAPHAAIYDLEPPLSHDGISVERKRAWLATWDTPIDIEPCDFKITVSGDHAFGFGFLRMSGTPKAAGKPISFWMRSTVCLERLNGAWRIVHEHTSVPFYMDGSLRPAFDLQP